MEDITLFLTLLESWYGAINIKQRRHIIGELLNLSQWFLLYRHKISGCCIYAENKELDHKHELKTAEILTQEGYHVLFAPRAMFKRESKKFDVFLIRDHFILEADLKNINSKNPKTISNRITEGAKQAPRLVIVIQSDLNKKNLIDGLRRGCQKSDSLKEIFLFYKRKFIRLNKKDIESNKVYELL